jgi:hypothetical protein
MDELNGPVETKDIKDSKRLQWIPIIRDEQIASGNELSNMLSLDFLDEEPTVPCAHRTLAEVGASWASTLAAERVK